MKILTANQKTVLAHLERLDGSDPRTVREIAEATGLSKSSAQTAVTALSRYGAVHQRGVALSGGATFAATGRPARD